MNLFPKTDIRVSVDKEAKPVLDFLNEMFSNVKTVMTEHKNLFKQYGRLINQYNNMALKFRTALVSESTSTQKPIRWPRQA